MRSLREFAEQQAESVAEAQREQFATLTLNTAVDLTSAALKRMQVHGAGPTSRQSRSAMRCACSSPRRSRSSAPPARASCASASGSRPASRSRVCRLAHFHLLFIRFLDCSGRTKNRPLADSMTGHRKAHRYRVAILASATLAAVLATRPWTTGAARDPRRLPNPGLRGSTSERAGDLHRTGGESIFARPVFTNPTRITTRSSRSAACARSS